MQVLQIKKCNIEIDRGILNIDLTIGKYYQLRNAYKMHLESCGYGKDGIKPFNLTAEKPQMLVSWDLKLDELEI